MSQTPGPDYRGTIVTMFLTVLSAGGLLLVMFLACGGFAVYMIGVAIGLGLLGYFHYLLWGHSLSQEVAGEREEAEIRESLEEESTDL
jgi:hypothetical protein